jgi:hypothetical protein
MDPHRGVRSAGKTAMGADEKGRLPGAERARFVLQSFACPSSELTPSARSWRLR